MIQRPVQQVDGCMMMAADDGCIIYSNDRPLGKLPKVAEDDPLHGLHQVGCHGNRYVVVGILNVCSFGTRIKQEVFHRTGTFSRQRLTLKRTVWG